MSSRVLDRARRALGFRLTLWYSAIFVLSCLIVFVVSYFVLSSALGINRDLIEAKADAYLSRLQRGGLDAFEKQVGTVQHPSRRSTFFVRIVNQKKETVFLSHAHLWEKFDLSLPQGSPGDGDWRYFPAKNDGDLLEVISKRLPDGSTLEVGKSIQDREEVLEHFRDTILAVTIPMILIGVAGGAFLAFRALRPIHNLTQTVRSIIETSKVDARVPANRTDGELNELVVLFNQMLQKIEVLIQGMKEALDNVAHDLRTPMTRLRAVAEQALHPDSSHDTCREALADCLEESERVTKMLDTLMDISEAETGTMNLSLEQVNLAGLIEEVSELYSYVADEKQVTLSVSAPNDLCMRADRARIRQVVANLVDNAIKYTPDGGHVEIEAFQQAQQVVLLVRDSGVGIPTEEMPRIWDRLYRGDKSRSRRGLGLGLSLVKAVVHAHRGYVEASNNPVGGTLFSLYFPLTLVS